MAPSQTGAPPSRVRAVVLLLAAGLFGTVAAALSRSSAAHPETPPGVVAVVNDAPIRAADFELTIGAIAADKRDPVTAADRRLALQRVIEEELLVQEGLARGLHQTDRRVREAVVQAMLSSILAEERSQRPSEADLQAYYENNRVAITAAIFALPPEDVVQQRVPPPPLASVREPIEIAYVRESQDRALREYLERLRADADIVSALEAAP